MLGILFGLIPALLSYFKARQEGKNTTYIAELHEVTERRRIDAQERAALNAEIGQITRAQLGHPIAWIPRFLIEMTAALYFMSIVIDSMFQLPGDISELPAPTAAVMATIFGGMFISSGLSTWTKNAKK